jgi:hypothetical protein
MSIRVFINAQGIDVAAGATALEAVRQWDAAAAAAVDAGTRLITDSRGLPLPSATPLSGGAILRLVAKRDRAAAPSDGADPAAAE